MASLCLVNNMSKIIVGKSLIYHVAGGVNQRVAAELLDHVVEKTDPGVHIERAGAIEVNHNLDVGFVRGAGNRSGAHERGL